MKKIEIKHRFTGNVIFAHECDENTLVITVSEAVKHGANLAHAYLAGADLACANLRGANLKGAKDGLICRMDFGGWSICIRSYHTQIGCKKFTNEKWLSFSMDDVENFTDGAKEWWKIHGEAVKSAIRCVMEKAKHEEKKNEGLEIEL